MILCQGPPESQYQDPTKNPLREFVILIKALWEALLTLTLSLLRVINVKIPLQPHKKYDITQ